jgi:hypothetical protein
MAHQPDDNRSPHLVRSAQAEQSACDYDRYVILKRHEEGQPLSMEQEHLEI